MFRRSAYTILLLILTATAGLGTAFGGRRGLVLSLACAVVVVLAVVLAWSSSAWRAGAGPVRYGLVTITGILCIAIVICDILRLLPETG